MDTSELASLCGEKPSQRHQFWKSIDVVMLHWDLSAFPNEFLGRIQTQKQPVWVQQRENMADAIDEARHYGVLPRRGDQLGRAMIGHTDMSPEDLTENLSDFFRHVCGELDEGERDIAQVQLAITLNGERIALPVAWQDFHSVYQQDLQATAS